MHGVEYSWWVEHVDVWRHAMGEETWRVGVVVFIYVLELHFVMFTWMCGIWIDFFNEHVSLLWGFW